MQWEREERGRERERREGDVVCAEKRMSLSLLLSGWKIHVSAVAVVAVAAAESVAVCLPDIAPSSFNYVFLLECGKKERTGSGKLEGGLSLHTQAKAVSLSLSFSLSLSLCMAK